MAGSMDKSIELKNSMLIFLDETIGFRRSLHFLHRWYETQDQDALINLIVEIGKEHYLNLWPLVNYCQGKDDGIDQTVHGLFLKHIRLPKEWTEGKEIMLSPVPAWLIQQTRLSYTNDLKIQEGRFWELHDWIHENSKEFDNPLSVIPFVLGKIGESKEDITKLVEVMKFFLGDTLLSCLEDESMSCFVNEVSKYYPDHALQINLLSQVIQENSNLNWKDALSRNQIQSKLWLLEKMQACGVTAKAQIKNVLESQTVIIVGGWVGILPWLMTLTDFEFYKLVHTPELINIDLDKTVHPAAEKLNGQASKFKYRSLAKDIKKYNFTQHKNLIVIDTIVEHFKDHGKWVRSLPKGTLVVLQGNNMFDVPDHVNCHDSLEEFVESCGLNTILWSGELILNKCLRFMAIGKV